MNKQFNIKVCGMRNLDNLKDLVQLSPDMIGLIFYPRSPRYVNRPEELIELLGNKRSFKLVGVFVNELSETIINLHKLLHFDSVQLHGNESINDINILKGQGFQIIKAIGIRSRDDFEKTEIYQNHVDLFLFDYKSEAYGGTGNKFDWRIIQNYTGQKQFLLSGGIGPDDKPVIDHPCFAGIDINSGFETEAGIKNIPEIRKFIKKFRNEFK